MVYKATPLPAYKTLFKVMQDLGMDFKAVEKTRALSGFKNENVVIPDTLVEQKVITTADNQSITLTITRPVGSEKELLPAHVYLHGGGWCVGSYNFSEKYIKDLVVRAHVVVIYVEYSLSPEVRFPVAFEECYSSMLWIHDHAASIMVDASRLTIGGDSAGGNLSAAVTILLKQRGHGHLVKGQVLLYPVTATIEYRQTLESYKAYGGGDYLLSREDITFFSNAYLGIDKPSPDIRFAPLLATSDELEGLPKALVVTAECDILRDEGEEYARRLTEAGVDTACMRMVGAIHAFAALDIDTPVYRHTLDLISTFLNRDAI